MLLFYFAILETEEDRAKMSDVYETHKSAMLRYALKITNNNEIAEDAVHDAFLSIIKHKEKYFSLSGRDLRALLVVITKNKCIDILRKQNAFVEDSIDDMEHALQAKDTPVEEQIILNEEYESIKINLDALDEISRLVLEMKYRLDMSYKEIGEHLNMTPKHVDTRLMRAKDKLRKMVEMGN